MLWVPLEKAKAFAEGEHCTLYQSMNYGKEKRHVRAVRSVFGSEAVPRKADVVQERFYGTQGS